MQHPISEHGDDGKRRGGRKRPGGGQLRFAMALLVLAGACGEPPPSEGVAKKVARISNSWSPVNCPEWDWSTEYPLKFSSDWDQTLKIYDTDYYANTTWRPSNMLFNNNVRHVGLRFDHFDVEQGYDRLRLSHQNGDQVFTGQTGVSGNTPPPLNQFLGPYPVKKYFTTGSGQLRFEWYTDGSINYTGYNVNALQIHCSATPSTPVNSLEVEPNFPYHGYLLGEGDVIYVKVRQPAGHKMGLLLWPRHDSSDIDFDIYGSTTYSKPGYAQKDQVGVWYSRRSGASVDLAIIPSWGTVGQGDRWVYIAIGAFEGRGQFRFQANIHARRDDTITVGVDFMPSAHNKQAVRRLIQKTTVAFYQATEGRVLLDKWQILWDAPNQGDIRLLGSLWAFTGTFFTPTPSNPQTTCWSATFDRIDVAGRDWCAAPGVSVIDPTNGDCDLSDALIEELAVSTMAHELAHKLFGLRDEYFSVGYTCGRSLMGGATAYAANITDFCVPHNAGADWTYVPGSPHSHSIYEDNWGCIATRLNADGSPPVPPIPPNYTPDAFYRLEGYGSADFPGIDIDG